MTKLASTPNNTCFSVTWMELSHESDFTSKDALVGPSIHPTIEAALLKVWVYVKNRIKGICQEEFTEEAESLGIDIFRHTANNHIPPTRDEMNAILNNIEQEKIGDVVDWYFKHSKFVGFESFYTIKEHVVEGGEPNDESGVSGVTTVVNRPVRDWRLSSGENEADLNKAHLGEYTLKVEIADSSGQVYFGLYNSALDRHPQATQAGIHGVLEIRNGLPAICLGITPDEPVIHVVTNTSNELSVIKDDPDDFPEWRVVEYTEQKHTGLVFKVDDHETFMEARTSIAHEVFGGYDFGARDVTDDDGWEIDGQNWEKTAQFDDSTSAKLKLKFTSDGTHIESIEAEEIDAGSLVYTIDFDAECYPDTGTKADLPLGFFCEANGYDKKDVGIIESLKEGDSMDLGGAYQRITAAKS